jgi:hypothetical protein
VAEGVEGLGAFAFEAEVGAEDAVGGGVLGGFGFTFGCARAGGFLGVGAVGDAFAFGNHDLSLLLEAREERGVDRQRDEDGAPPLASPALEVLYLTDTGLVKGKTWRFQFP